MGLFSRTNKRRPQIIDIDNEIHRIAKFMWESESKVESITVEKILISERDYHAIWNGICKIISDAIGKESQNFDQRQALQAITGGQKLANRIIDKLYDVEWVY